MPAILQSTRRALLRMALFAVGSSVLLAAHAADTRVKIVTSAGTIVLRLDAQRAPRSVDNFLQYVRAGFYSNTIFHRVIPGFMIQGGGFTADMTEKPTRAPIPLESQNGLHNLRGTIAMARTGDPNSATAQFYINLVDNPALDYPKPDGHGYAVFGYVVSGMPVVDAIAASPTHDFGPYQDVPVKPVLIQSISILTN